MLRLVLAAAGMAALAAGALAQGAHVHGHATLNIAIEQNTVQMELEAPAADIVGFEHAPQSAEERAALAEAEAALKSPLELFRLPEAAGCRVDGVDMEHRGEGDHSEFHVTYTLACTDIAAIDAIAFGYFERFPRAEELEVNVVSDAGQQHYEAVRNSPSISIGSGR